MTVKYRFKEQKRTQMQWALLKYSGGCFSRISDDQRTKETMNNEQKRMKKTGVVGSFFFIFYQQQI